MHGIGFYGGDLNPFESAELAVSAEILDQAAAAAGVDLILGHETSPGEVQPFQKNLLAALGMSGPAFTVGLGLGPSRGPAPSHAPPSGGGGAAGGVDGGAVEDLGLAAMVAAARVLACSSPADLPTAAREAAREAALDPGKGGGKGGEAGRRLAAALGSLTGAGGFTFSSSREAAALSAALAVAQRALSSFPTDLAQDEAELVSLIEKAPPTERAGSAAAAGHLEMALQLRASKKRKILSARRALEAGMQRALGN